MTNSFSKNNILVIGSVLLDHYISENKHYLGGACFNFAYHIHQLIGRLDFISRIGQDQAGAIIKEELTRRGFPTALIQYDRYKPTKTVQVIKNASNEPHYIIASDVATEYLDAPALAATDIENYQLIYFGTTIQNGLKSRATMRQLAEQGRHIKFCDINLRPGKYHADTIDYTLRLCNALKINHEELEVLSFQYDLSGDDPDKLLAISQRFMIPSICLTKAENGSLLYHQQQFSSHASRSLSVIDSVGAGDAFAAMYAIGLIRGWSAEQIVSVATDFASAICQIQGAVPEQIDFYLPWRQRLEQL